MEPFWIGLIVFLGAITVYVTVKWYQRGAELRDMDQLIKDVRADAEYAVVKFDQIMDDWYGEDKDIPEHLASLGSDIKGTADRVNQKNWPSPGEVIDGVEHVATYHRRRKEREE